FILIIQPPDLLSVSAGYTVWSHNLVAISRLRGSSLRILTVSEESIYFDPDQSRYMEGDPVHCLVKDVSLGLGRVWHPCLDSSVVLSEPTQHFHCELHAFSTGMVCDMCHQVIGDLADVLNAHSCLLSDDCPFLCEERGNVKHEEGRESLLPNQSTARTLHIFGCFQRLLCH
ncbi:hypothetical protein XENOCAPTIV_004330, partial [Xenoophorus captivus]